ncbi:transcription initiation factor TFIID subunit 8-like [Cynara cardunculus var. scolymus]|uniref:transcription initiation factor TFIID subunit 8-like n=1 Tax=Cynara cardunculus var. scolymus TaxID=59895 RepID=UPI000D63073C|nr:transcription initiation factor TFIID subunit 8-like [Cynara cardunculus var. scolymus]
MKKKKLNNSSSPSSNGDLESSDFHTAVARIAVAQTCQSVGYRGAETSALKTLTDVAVRYLQSLAKSAATSATSTGRTQCNLLDIVRALEDLHTDLGFHGNSEPKSRLNLLSDSSLLRDTMKFVYWTHEIPFSKPLPRRCPALASNPPCFSNESAKWNHIPRWLPAFPKINDGEEEKPVVAASSEVETAWEKKSRLIRTSSCEISTLPEKRKKVSFKIGGGGGGGRNEIETGIGSDLRNGVCKAGKRISFQMYDDEKSLNASSRSNHDSRPSMKKKLEESCSRTKVILMH